jgi:ABC-type glutathione transport system ATPase component
MNDRNLNIEIAVRARRVVLVEAFKLAENRLTFLFGESGIGKSLIARAFYGLLDPDDFSVRISGRDYASYLADDSTRAMQENGFFVFQEPSSHLNPLMNIRQQLQEGILAQWPNGIGDLKQLWQGEAAHEVDKLLEVYPKPFRPSGGEKQRVLLAMALVKMDLMIDSDDRRAPRVFIFDEPTGSLDNQSRDLFLSQLLMRYRQRPFTCLFITHDYSILHHIMTAYPDIMGRMDFRELTPEGERLAFKKFHPATFSGWLEALRREKVSSNQRQVSSPLLTVESDLEVLGRTLQVSSDRPRRGPAPIQLFPGRLIYLKAPSGTGKTTLVKAVMGLTPAQKMNVMLLGKRLTESTPRRYWQKHIWGKTMTMVFQHADEALNMHSTVEETLRGLPLRGTTFPVKIENGLGELFDPDTIGILLKKKVWMLSGGQKQRLNLLRSFFLDTDVLMLDEPLNGLDFESCTKVIGMLRKKLNDGKGMLVISHNEEIFDTLVSDEDRYYLHARASRDNASSPKYRLSAVDQRGTAG